MAYANITFKGVAIAAPIPFGMVTSLNGHGGHHAACARWQRGKGQPQNFGVRGILRTGKGENTLPGKVHLIKKRLRQAKGCRRGFPLFVRKARAPFWPRKRKRCIFLPVSAILKQTEGSKAYDI